MSGITLQPNGLSTAASISNLVVGLMSAHTGRGPTKAWTSIDEDLVTVVLRDTLTKGERSLVSGGHGRLVLDTRRAHQETMRQDLIDGVTRLVGRKVIAFMSENHLDPDIAIENFVLEPRRDQPPHAHEV
ncbi:MAG: Na-translocating system protein MpsC family protein [Solirubrobacteraceae bacterium]